MSTIWQNIKAGVKVAFGYDAVQNSRYRRTRGAYPLRGESIELNSYDRDKLISALMDMKRNDPVVKAISSLRKSDVVGAGILPQPQTISDQFNDDVQGLWGEWSRYPEVTGTMNMCMVQQEMADAPLFFGDIGILLLKSGKVQLIEGDRIGEDYNASTSSESDPIQNGVVVSKQGRPKAYLIGDRINGTLRNVRRVGAQNMLLYFKRMRPQQFRGIPELAAALNSLQDIAEYEATEMISAKVSASLSAVVKRNESVQFELQDRLSDDDQDDIGRLQRFEPGTFHYLEPGEDISTIASNGRPNVDGIEFVMYHLRKVGASVGIPVEFIMSTIGQTSFSASQGLLLQYQGSVEHNQKQLIYQLDRIYRWKLGRWIAEGELVVPPDVDDPYQCRWQSPAFRWVNKAAQVKADMHYVEMGAQSLDDIASQFGMTADTALRRKAQNIRQAQIIAEEYGLESYRELFNTLNTSAQANFAELLAGAVDNPEQAEKTP